MELVNRQRFTDMLRTLVDVTKESHVYISMDEPIKFEGYATHYTRNGGVLLAEVLHTINGPVYRIDTEWEENHPMSFMCPPHGSNIELGMDNRGWVFIAIRNRNDYPESHCIRILAGCRNFSLEQAKDHWKDNPEVYPRVLMAEQIAIHRGWLPKQNIISKIEEILRSMSDKDLIAYAKQLGVELPIDAGELAYEKTPTIVFEGMVDQLQYEREVKEGKAISDMEAQLKSYEGY